MIFCHTYTKSWKMVNHLVEWEIVSFINTVWNEIERWIQSYSITISTYLSSNNKNNERRTTGMAEMSKRIEWTEKNLKGSKYEKTTENTYTQNRWSLISFIEWKHNFYTDLGMQWSKYRKVYSILLFKLVLLALHVWTYYIYMPFNLFAEAGALLCITF